MADSSSTPTSGDKPVIVRVKRKAFQSPLDAFWLEINERPLKRALHDFEKLSISNASSSRVEELRKKKILVRHVKTVASSEDAFDVLQSFVPNSSVELNSGEKNEGRRRSLKAVNRQDPLQVKARQRQEILSRHARFEQIWRSRKETHETPEDESIYDLCKLYDVVRVDVEEEEHVVKVQNDKDTDLGDCKMMAEYLPLLRDLLPNAAEEIESDIQDFMFKQGSPDGYVYDFYAVNEDACEMEADPTSLFPLVQVDDHDDFFDGPEDTEYESDDSNAENNPMNDYPEEETSEDEDEDEITSRSSDEKSEGESETSGSKSEEEVGSGSQVSYDYRDPEEEYDWSDEANHFFEDGMHSDGDDEPYM